jgi:hypothetical protein
MSDKH